MKKIVTIALAALGLVGCSSEKENKGTPEKILVTRPVLVDTSYTMDYVADIKSVYYVELRARVKGYIERINTDEGKEVKKDQVLFYISNEDYKEELLKAKAALKILQAELKAQQLEYKNLGSLVEKNVMSKTELEIATTKEDALKAKIEEAEADITEAEINLSRTEIRAPFDGVIDLIPNKEGNLIEEGSLLSTVTSNQSVFAYFNVSEKEYLDFFSRVQMADSEKVSLIMANNALHDSPGIIETVNGKIDNATGNLTIRAQFPNPDRLIKHGSSGKVRVYMPLKGVMLIPQKCAIEIQDKNFVFVVNEGNEVQLKHFKPRFRMADFYVVESGLSAQDKIVYEGIQYLKDGDKIEPQELQLKVTANK